METQDERQTAPPQRFFRYFQLEATALQEQMAKLANLPVVGGERIDAIEHCASGIARLQKEVQDAASYVPAHDQKTYSTAVKALQEKLEQTKITLQPKAKFSFKNSVKKNDSAISLNDAAELAMQQKARLFKDPKDLPSSPESSEDGTPGAVPTPGDASSRPPQPHRRGSLGKFLDAAGQKSPIDLEDTSNNARIRRMSFAQANSVSISSHKGVHIILPPSASHATSSGSLTSLQDCIVDMSMPTTTGKPFATLQIKNIKQSLLVCGNVNGAAHVTGVEHSVIVVAARQFRMHDCKDCIVYLHANGQPIIEDSRGIFFAPLPEKFKPQIIDLSGENNWEQVQDFKWLKSEPSPNWSILADERRLDDEQWARITSSELALSLEESLRIAGVRTT